MKKISVVILALLMCISATVTAFADETSFVPSISSKPTPDVVGPNPAIVGLIRDGAGVVVKEVTEDEIIFTPLGEAGSSSGLGDLYDELSDPNGKLSELAPAINGAAEEILGAGKNADDFVIRDLFEIELLGEAREYLDREDHTLELVFDLGIKEFDLIGGMVYVNGEWVPIKVVNNGDGTVTAYFKEVGPVAFLVPANPSDYNPPATGDNANVGLWFALEVLSLGAIVGLAGLYRRNLKNDSKN